ncbi:MAG TPA: TIGR04283 family arsenosugar biosynthesis glycosyltransferase [Blastocatellia bacterium]|nr:TIGR04283 family arsenosugar biosynthesis glycosyltransferase [Blastocatellia bacterium]HMV85495.1 TIGR04283 family arsenosugar biosynthesis glycosyltransferase [Blastocatellia bacterium]HMX26040.1 TIGR04283 family arsenosugar biosynthesis glycosyltransferase [Blastocatellia bacterium]HMY70307.1 TIGR04283 family arsenosugar biosynthesis glycosyltransferase [Blastocatellia bacterium]HMZ18690.1 TIGR04283 family arsenosugar biosynthesis glycosyltransferase [Blastocatellia bacterium]
MTISIIIPTFNEAKTIRELAATLARLPGIAEIIIADGGSQDDTVQLARRSGLRVIEAPRGRGPQMNAAAKPATGEVLLFLHADTRLPENAAALIEAALEDARVCGGNFSLRFDGATREARLLTWLYPLLRLGGMCYGDSAIFVRRQMFEQLGGYRDYPIFEDCDLYRRLKRAGRFVRLKACATTSSRRFEGRFVRTFVLWSLMQVGYWLGANPSWLNRMYKPLR